MNKHTSIVDVPGLKVGHAQDLEGMTGCTVILCPEGTVGGVDQRGGAPGTRETDLLRPGHLVNHVHAVVLAGGSAYGLDAASGVMRYLREKGIGFPTGYGVVPIVPAAILYDLGVGRSDRFPTAEMGYAACLNASSQPPAEGNVGAGTGASVGKIFGMAQAMKTGIGSASIHLPGGLVVAALIAVNALGDIYDPDTRTIIAGVRRSPDSRDIWDTLEVMKEFSRQAAEPTNTAPNTVIGIVATNARLTKEQANKVASMAHNGLALTIRPAHTMQDGDTLFSLATGEVEASVDMVGAFAVEAVKQAVLRAARSARSIENLPGAGDESQDLGGDNV